MRFRKGDRVEVLPEPEDEGFLGSYFTAVVRGYGTTDSGRAAYDVQYDELMEDDEVTKMKEMVELKRVRPICEDDSATKPLWQRMCGDAVDVWTDDAWWQSYVTGVFDDYIKVYYHHPASKACSTYTIYVNPEHHPQKDPEKRNKVRTGLDWDLKAERWVPRPRKFFGTGAGDRRDRQLAERRQREWEQQQGQQQAGAGPSVAAAGAGRNVAAPRPSPLLSPHQQLLQRAGSAKKQRLPTTPASPASQAAKAGARAGGVLSETGAAAAASWSEDEDEQSGAGLSGAGQLARQQSQQSRGSVQPARQQSQQKLSKSLSLFGSDEESSSSEEEESSSSEDVPLAQRARQQQQKQPQQKQQKQKQKQPQQKQEQQKQRPQKQQGEPSSKSGGASKSVGELSSRRSASVPKSSGSRPRQQQQQQQHSVPQPAAQQATSQAIVGAGAPTAGGAAAAHSLEWLPSVQNASLAAKDGEGMEWELNEGGDGLQLGAEGSIFCDGGLDSLESMDAMRAIDDFVGSLEAEKEPRPPSELAFLTSPAAGQPLASPRLDAEGVALAAPPQPQPAAAAAAAGGEGGGREAAPATAATGAALQRGASLALETQLFVESEGDTVTSTSTIDVAAERTAGGRQATAASRPAPKAAAGKAAAGAKQGRSATKPAVMKRKEPTEAAAAAGVAAERAPPKKKAKPAAGPTKKAAAAAAAAAASKAPAVAVAAPNAVAAPPKAAAAAEAPPKAAAAPAAPRKVATAPAARPRSAAPVPKAASPKAFVIPKKASFGPAVGDVVTAADDAVQPDAAAEQVLPSPRGTVLPSPRGTGAAAAAAAGARGPKAAGQKRPAGEAQAAGAAGVAKHSRDAPSSREKPLDVPHDFPTVYCIDNIGGSITTEVLDKTLRQLYLGIKSVKVHSVALDDGRDYMAGFAVVRFKSKEDAWLALPRLKQLCMVTQSSDIPRPLIVHEPRVASGFPWGLGHLPGHLQLEHSTSPHFAQTNSIEFDMALAWRKLSRTLHSAKESVCRRQEADLVEVFKRYQEDMNPPPPPSDGAAPPNAADAPPPPPPPPPSPPPAPARPSRCLWLQHISPPRDTPAEVKALEDHIRRVFDQFGYPQKVELLRDPVTGWLTGSAVVWMETPQRVELVATNLREMIFMLNGTPRPLDAAVAQPGPPRGSQSVYDRALRRVFGRDDNSLQGSVEFIELPDALWASPSATPAERAAIYLRRLMTLQHLPEMDQLKELGVKREVELGQEQEDHYEREKVKLERLKKLQDMAVMGELAELHNIKFRIYRHRGAAGARGSRPRR